MLHFAFALSSELTEVAGVASAAHLVEEVFVTTVYRGGFDDDEFAFFFFDVKGLPPAREPTFAELRANVCICTAQMSDGGVWRRIAEVGASGVCTMLGIRRPGDSRCLR